MHVEDGFHHQEERTRMSLVITDWGGGSNVRLLFWPTTRWFLASLLNRRVSKSLLALYKYVFLINKEHLNHLCLSRLHFNTSATLLSIERMDAEEPPLRRCSLGLVLSIRDLVTGAGSSRPPAP